MRALDQLTATRLGNVENVYALFLSPDGQWVGFIDQPNGSLKRIAITGGPVVTICLLPPGIGFSGAS